MARTVTMAEAKGELSALASRASAGERFVLVRRGRPVAGLVGPADVEALERAARASTFLEALGAFRRRHGASLPKDALRVRRTPGRRIG
jgi:prevent-host-death family protein